MKNGHLQGTVPAPPTTPEMAASSTDPPFRCSHCGTSSTTLKPCSGCSRVYYCNNSTCLQKAYPSHKSVCSPRVVRVHAADDGALMTAKERETIEQVESKQLHLLTQSIIEQKIRPEILRSDVSTDLTTWLRHMLLGPAQPLNKQKNFIQDILNDVDLCADAEIFVEAHAGCHKGLILRNRGDGRKKKMYPDPEAELRVREDVLQSRCLLMVLEFSKRKGIENMVLQQKAAKDFYVFYRRYMLEKGRCYNTYTGMSACMGDQTFMKRSEDIVMFGLGLEKEMPLEVAENRNVTTCLKNAPPPFHTVVVFAIAMVGCLWSLPSWKSIDEHATIEAFTTSIFKEGPFNLSPLALGVIRMVFAMICIIVTRGKIVNGAQFKATYLAESKLQRGVIDLAGVKTQGFFTSWAWNLLGLTFFLGGLVPLLVVYGREDVLTTNPWILRGALISFEIAAPCALFISFIVTYSLWPKAYKTHGSAGTIGFRNWVNLWQHNGNTAMVLVELCLMGGLPVKISHAAVAPIFAGCYQLFMWLLANHWSPKHGPVFLYFFSDTTLGMKTTVFLLVLLAVMFVFFALFSLLEMGVSKIEEGGYGALPNVCCVMLVSSLLMKFKD